MRHNERDRINNLLRQCRCGGPSDYVPASPGRKAGKGKTQMKLYKARLVVDLSEAIEKIGYGSKHMDVLEKLGFGGGAESSRLLMEGEGLLNTARELPEEVVEVVDVTDSYVILETAAPKEYDGFSTTQLFSEMKKASAPIINLPVRIVAMEHRDFEWQTMRYSSGMSGMYYWAIIQGGEKP